MPQFDPANFLPQLVWLAVIFAVLYFAVVRPTLPKVGRVIDQREATVAGDLDAAEAAKAEADGIRGRYDKGIAGARDRAQAAVADAKADAARRVAARRAAATASLEARAQLAAGQLAVTSAASEQSMEASTAELTREVVLRLAGISVAPADAEAALAARR